jgi:DNA mismatch repair protein MSH4
MISDKRIEAIDSLIASSLNEENVQSPPRVREVFTPHFVPLKQCPQTGIGAVTVRVFAVKVSPPCIRACSAPPAEIRNPEANFNRLLDVARETFKENVADIYQLGRELSEAHGLPLALVYQDSGFILSIEKVGSRGRTPRRIHQRHGEEGKGCVLNLGLGASVVRCRDFPFMFIVPHP